MLTDTVKIDRRGVLVIPAKLRKALGIKEDSLLMLDVVDGALRIRPAVAVPVERYTDHRKAEFLLNNAVDSEEYERAVAQVKQMGLDPGQIPHDRPRGETPQDPRVP